MNDFNAYFSGQRLYGDDFDPDQLAAWYADEKEGYADKGHKDRSQYTYTYHALNTMHGFRYISRPRLEQVLGLGSAYGDEFKPIIDRIGKLVVVDPSDAFEVTRYEAVPVEYVKPRVDGVLPFADDTFDLVTSFGVLHHIANVSFVLGEIHRCLAAGGYALIREPIVSMGDWSKPRHGLTKRERGIPFDLFREMVSRADFEIVKATPCIFPLTRRILGKVAKAPYNSNLATRLDTALCSLSSFNRTYHRTRTLQKIGPTSVFFVLRKPA